MNVLYVVGTWVMFSNVRGSECVDNVTKHKFMLRILELLFSFKVVLIPKATISKGRKWLLFVTSPSDSNSASIQHNASKICFVTFL